MRGPGGAPPFGLPARLGTRHPSASMLAAQRPEARPGPSEALNLVGVTRGSGKMGKLRFLWFSSEDVKHCGLFRTQTAFADVDMIQPSDNRVLSTYIA